MGDKRYFVEYVSRGLFLRKNRGRVILCICLDLDRKYLGSFLVVGRWVVFDRVFFFYFLISFRVFFVVRYCLGLLYIFVVESFVFRFWYYFVSCISVLFVCMDAVVS